MMLSAASGPAPPTFPLGPSLLLPLSPPILSLVLLPSSRFCLPQGSTFKALMFSLRPHSTSPPP